MISTHIQKSQYQNFLQSKFSLIYSDSNDLSPVKTLYADLINRQQILFMQFQMEKKGKNFGIAEWRLLKIENELLYQVDKNQQQKLLPFPNSITTIRKIDDNDEWADRYAQFQAKIIMRFSQRTDITVYFRSVIQCNQIAMFFVSKIRQGLKKNFDSFFKLYRTKLVDQIIKKISLSKQQSKNFQNAKMKAKLNQYFKKNLNDKNYVQNLLQVWKSKALFVNKQLNFGLKIIQIDTKIDDNPLGFVKIWAKGTVCKHIQINRQNTIIKLKNTHKSIKIIKNFDHEFIDLLSTQEIQIQVQINGILWKTERFISNDLHRIKNRYTNIELNLSYKGQIIFIRVGFRFKNSFKFLTKQTISPKSYRVIDQLFNCDSQRPSTSVIHNYYQTILNNQRNSAFYYTNFNRFKQLNQLLKIEDLVLKFYSVPPFNELGNIQYKGTYIYEYFLRNYDKDLFYQIQKIFWRFKQKKYKRVLTALKIFDQNPKFNFTETFFYLVKRMYEIAERQTFNRSKDILFSKNLKGIESICFFLSIGIIKTFPSIFIHQQFIHKRALPYNSLLFIYIMNKELPIINKRINKIQLNIEAFFGINFVNLLCKLFQGELFNRILIMVLSQKKQDAQSIYLFTLIAAFLSIVKLIDSFSCTYASAQHYIIVFEEYCKSIINKFQFFTQMKKWKQIAQQYSLKREFEQLINDLTQFYLSNAYNGQLGDISKQIYQEFTCYHYKNQNDLRKILIFVDKIDIGTQEESHNLTLSIFQSAVKLYEHEFKGIRLSQIGHFIQIKLIKLQELTIICNTQRNSYSCRIDPKEVPSNLYFHFVKPLILTYHLSPQQNRHIFFQAYIKDSCQIQSLENPIPNKYRQILLQKQVSKQTILFCKRFAKTFRMRENNFNLLYSKLGWFGNHYLIPDQRLIDIDILGHRQGGKDQLFTQISETNKYTRFVYGKALAPYPSDEGRKLCIQLIKQNIHTTCQPALLTSLKSSLTSQFNIYNSAGRLICYSLDNFGISTSIQFLQFYYEMDKKLPLINYLSYNPKLFYLLPTFTMQVSSFNSVCTIIISQKGSPLKLNFTQIQIKQIQEQSLEYNRMPQELEFGYTDQDMYFDDFLYLLRLNILKKVIAIKDKKVIKQKKWGNTLVSTSVFIPNYKLHYFYEVMNETKQIVQLQFKQVKRIKQRIEYNDYGLVSNRWIKVYCVAKLTTSQLIYYYVLSQLQRKKYILKESDFIKVDEEVKKCVNLSDDIANSMEIITYELNQIFQI